MSIDAGAQVAIILLAFGPCVVIVNLLYNMYYNVVILIYVELRVNY